MIASKAVLRKVSLTVPFLILVLCLPVRAETNLYGGSGLFLTHSTDILDPGLWRTGLYLHAYEYKEPVDPKNFDFVPVLSYSPFPKAELMATQTIRRHDDDIDPEAGLGDGSIGLKYLFHPMLAGLAYANLGWGERSLGPDSGSSDLGFMAISSHWAGPVRFDLNLGYQITDLGGSDDSDLFLWGLGASWPVDANLLVFAEYNGAITTEGDSRSPSGLTGGLNYYLSEKLELTVGVGTGLVAQGPISPDWRGFIGLTYTIGAKSDYADRGAPGDAARPPRPPRKGEPVDPEMVKVKQRIEPVDPEMVKVKQRIELVMIRFPYDNNVLSAAGKEKLNEIVADLKKYPRIAINITGHADSRGTASYNEVLGMRRAEAVRTYLVSQGIEESRIGISSQGEMKPLVKEKSKSAWIQNRRATFSVGIP